ncbi:putative lipid II flippase FtsW [Pseudacidovorax sp. RU35E]|uniref:putative lipid II flippase FtsW n=1 Tax=Pseudacidovorax sp. RU35E TaxID=1907403 RepID=UPI000956FBF4|nr:putative lipid II flippase FtsW [Pseudacidovorax sp. RU35E]SIR45378.1 cell division-specific peptidoglycan biosynthesis regulator FtsW [Pseudacidovorax sp. RU35E]
MSARMPAAATPNEGGSRFFGWFRRAAKSSMDALPMHLPVRLGGADIAQTRAAPVRVAGFDQPLVWVTLALLMWGLVMVFSASIAMGDNPRFNRVGGYSESYHLIRHAISLVFAFVAGLIAFQVPMRTWERTAPWLFVVALLLLVVVLIPHVGINVNGARRWLPLGFMRFQPSELAKLAMVFYAASYMVRKMEIKERFFRAVLPMGVAVVVVGMLLLAEPDMGAFMVIAIIAMGILFLGGVNARMFFLIAMLVVVAFATMVAASPWRRERIFAYLDPFSEEHALGKGYQLSHSLIAIGRGEIFGVGLGGSVEKLHWLPEAHTDFLLAVIGEELGLVGVLIAIALFLWLTRRIMHIGRQAIALDRVFAGLAAQGVGVWMGFQTFINMGVNLGALPTKGLTLPLMSFGGSAILMNVVALAVVLRVDYENRVLMRGGRV